jgi:hypothetical protein
MQAFNFADFMPRHDSSLQAHKYSVSSNVYHESLSSFGFPVSALRAIHPSLTIDCLRGYLKYISIVNMIIINIYHAGLEFSSH